jgi:UDP-N-acetylglucosamine 2-epimerase (non-hydrolysing)
MTFVTILFGTRPEYLKLAPLIKIFEKEKHLPFQVIYIEQHNSIVDIPIVNNYIKIPIEDSKENRLEHLGSQIISKLPVFLSSTTHLIIQGDTASVFYSGLVAFQKQIKIVHIEAGLRTYDISQPFPEEGYRQMISRITSYNFTPHEDSSNLLIQERCRGKIFCVGNTIIDLIKSYNHTVVLGDTVLITCHRRENWSHMDEFIKQLNILVIEHPHLKFKWFLHPNKQLQTIIKNTVHPSVSLQEPLNHYDFSNEIANSYCLLTDSGGLQEEASYYGKQCVVLRFSTERIHIGKPYIHTIKSFNDISSRFNLIEPKLLEPCYVYGNGDSSKKIYEFLKSQIILESS